MQLISLAATICKAFSEAKSDHLRTVQKVKQGQPRDVVTELDIRLHDVSAFYASSKLAECKFLSEEGCDESIGIDEVLCGKWLVVDPLDGSNNYSLELPGYGYMAAYIDEGLIEGACIVLPEYDQYILIDGRNLLVSQPVGNIEVASNAPIYYAYPPKQGAFEFATRIELQKLIDSKSGGMYRYGSACIGLYNLMQGKHLAFIGHQIRVWDAIAFLPILRACNIEVKYCLSGRNINLVASRNHEILESSVKIFQENQGVILKEYEIGQQLKVSKT
jgi:fructose-1,6-bisphosphatase/inositol monophosphatase family enzyme